MEGKGFLGTDGTLGGLFLRKERIKIPLIEFSPTSSSSEGTQSPEKQSKLGPISDDSKDFTEVRNYPSTESQSKKSKRSLRPRRSSESSSEEEGKSEKGKLEEKPPGVDKRSEPAEKSLFPWDTPLLSFRLKGNSLAGGEKFSDASKPGNSELKETRLNQLSSERDRSISVDRSSSSSDEKVRVKKDTKSSSIERKSHTKSPLEDSDRKKTKDNSNIKNSSSKSKDLSKYAEEKRRASSDDKPKSRRSKSRSRSQSRSVSRHKRKGSSPQSPRRDRRRSKDRYRDRSPRKRSPKRSPKSRRSRSYSRGRRSRSRGYRSRSRGHSSRSRGYRSRSPHHSRSRDYRRRSRSRSYERRRYRDRSSSRGRYRKRRRSPSSSRSRSQGSSRERSKGRLGASVNKIGSLPLSTTVGAMTPQMALQQTMAAMNAKAQALTGIELPKYYNPAAVNPLKYAEQVQKRKLLWQSKKETTEDQSKSTIWNKLTFSQDEDGKMTAKFRKLMGIKNESDTSENEAKEAAADPNAEPVALQQKQEELFRNLDQQYEMARMSTHTHRGVGLGYSSQAIFPPLQKP